MPMANMLCVVSYLLAAANGLAPPAMIQLPSVRSTALSQMPRAIIGKPAVPDASARSMVQSAQSLRAPPPVSHTPTGWTTIEAAPKETWRRASPTGGAIDHDREAQLEHQQVSQSSIAQKMSAVELTRALGMVLLAAVAGAAAMAGIRCWLEIRAKLVDTDAATELTACSTARTAQPRLACAAYASESIESFDPLGLNKVSVGKCRSREADISYGRQGFRYSLGVLTVCRHDVVPGWLRPSFGVHASRPSRLGWILARRAIEEKVDESAAGSEAHGRSSFDSSPDWVKSVVAGLTAGVNAFMGNQPEMSAPRTRTFKNITPEMLLKGINEDFDRQYLWTGDIDPEIYDEECIFTDPTLSFQGLSQFESNLRNLRPILDSLVPEAERKCILRSISQDTSGCVAAEWTMVGNLALPWSPRIELGGRTVYTPGPDGRIVAYDENWDISGAEALGQILTPSSVPKGAEHWPGRLDGSPPPDPRVSLHAGKTESFVLLPGFGNDAVDYVAPLEQDGSVGLRACLARRGCSLEISPVSRVEWLKVFLNGLLDEDFRAGNGRAEVAFGWYLDKAQKLIEQQVAVKGGPVIIVGHSAGGWLARAMMQRQGKDWIVRHVKGLVSLGTPHLPPPDGRFDMTMGCLRNLNIEQPGAFFKDVMFYITVAGDAVVGENSGPNLPILELINAPSTESAAFNSYEAVCGEGAVTGDSVVPLKAAHLDGASQLTLKDCVHSINVVGTTKPTDQSYLCEKFIDDWLVLVAKHL